jgi:hypothetical protein
MKNSNSSSNQLKKELSSMNLYEKSAAMYVYVYQVNQRTLFKKNSRKKESEYSDSDSEQEGYV